MYLTHWAVKLISLKDLLDTHESLTRRLRLLKPMWRDWLDRFQTHCCSCCTTKRCDRVVLLSPTNHLWAQTPARRKHINNRRVSFWLLDKLLVKLTLIGYSWYNQWVVIIWCFTSLELDPKQNWMSEPNLMTTLRTCWKLPQNTKDQIIQQVLLQIVQKPPKILNLIHFTPISTLQRWFFRFCVLWLQINSLILLLHNQIPKFLLLVDVLKLNCGLGGNMGGFWRVL